MLLVPVILDMRLLRPQSERVGLSMSWTWAPRANGTDLLWRAHAQDHRMLLPDEDLVLDPNAYVMEGFGKLREWRDVDACNEM